MTKTIAITGASGFTGGAIAQHFLACGWHVIGFGRRDKPNLHPSIAYQEWDMTQGNIQIKQAIDVVVHTAAYVGDHGKRSDFIQANVNGTQSVLDSFRDAGQIIHISSASVYDPFKPTVNLHEDAPYGTRYLNHYSESKMLAEKVIRDYPHPNKIILRPRAIYGQGDTTLLPRLKRLYRAGYMIGFGTGDNHLSLTHINNFCYAVELATQYQTVFDIFNITDDDTITQHDLLALIAQYLEHPFKPLFIPQALSYSFANFSDYLKKIGIPMSLSTYALHNLSHTVTLNIDKAKKLLNYAPPHKLDITAI